MRVTSLLAVLFVVGNVGPLASFAGDTLSTVDSFTEPVRKVELSPSESGILTDIYVHEGSIVRAGEELGSLDRGVLEKSLAIAKTAMQSQGRLNAAKAELDLKKQRLERLLSLAPKGFAFPEEIERARADHAIAEANLLSAEEQRAIDSLEHDKVLSLLDRRSIRSPINGVVLKVHREEREFVTSASPVVFTVVQLDPLRIVFQVPTVAAEALRGAKRANVFFPDTNQNAKVEIEYVSVATDPQSGTVRVKTLLANPSNQFQSGVRCQLKLSEVDAVAQANP